MCLRTVLLSAAWVGCLLWTQTRDKAPTSGSLHSASQSVRQSVNLSFIHSHFLFSNYSPRHSLRYSIDPQSDPEALFRIASDSGLITTVMELDREREQWHNITVIATQRGMRLSPPPSPLSFSRPQEIHALWLSRVMFSPHITHGSPGVRAVKSCNEVDVELTRHSFPVPDNPNLVTRVVVAIETLDQNDNAPELDRQYTTSVCDSSTPGQVSAAANTYLQNVTLTLHFISLSIYSPAC